MTKIICLTITILAGSALRIFAQGPAVFSYKVGQYEVVTLAEAEGKGNKSILIDAKQEMLEKFAPDGTFPNGTNAFLIRSAGRNLLVDAGFGRKLFANLDSSGVKPEQIDGILLTHCHGDHIGGLIKDGKATFPNARLYIDKIEYEYWTKKAPNEQSKAVFAAYKGRIQQFAAPKLGGKTTTILPGVSAIAAYGHTPGHVAYLVQSGAERLVIWGDLTHATAIQMPFPQVAVSYDVNPKDAVKARMEILDFVAKNNIPVAGMHIRFPGMGMVKVDPATGGYALKPVYPYLDATLSPAERAKDVVARLTLEEKVPQMLNDAPAINRLGIPSYNWWNECLHGVARTPEYKVTVYPQAIGMAAGWDVEAMKLMGDYTAVEGRAIYNTASAKGDRRIYRGLTYWTPNINIFRDPRWGRGQETYGEDPFLTASIGKNFVLGLQGEDKTALKAAACAKHYAVHSGPESSRHVFNAKASAYDLWDTYLPAFKELVVDAGVVGVMCAYNAFETQPCCGSDKLMVDILRKDWKFSGYVTSDCGAIDDFYRTHKTHPDAAAAAADAVIHGTDVDCGREAYLGLTKAVADGIIQESQIDMSLRRLFEIRFRLGVLEPNGLQPFANIDSTSLEAREHKELALKMAKQSVVMLKNDGTLPLRKNGLKKVAVLGPNADNSIVQLGNYNGFPTRTVTLVEGLKEKLPSGVDVVYEKGCDYVVQPDSLPSVESVVAKVKDADIIIFAGGISPKLEGEEMRVNVPGFSGGDRTSILLPKLQTDMMKALKATGKPVIFIMMTGSAIATPWESANVNAILNAWYGGEAIGTALADILMGDYNPSGHLPLTFYADDADLPDFNEYDMDNRTYKYFKGKALYPFGFGLSYTRFDYEWNKLPMKEYRAGDIIQCEIKIKNTGAIDGDAVPQIYIKYPEGERQFPIKELRAFERKTIRKGEAYVINVSIPVEKLAKWSDTKGQLSVPTGAYAIFAGEHSADERATATFTVKQ
ncbi:MAG: glycoside hydrolase family 3 C-terminal domain-containing protein [Tannerellaceae bacterium]|jgi:beta-glucosidase|nr:glycoside hydrolase family 3 C-terminal domain-containing protein [Tannerellaceae bacterium]